VLTPRVLRPGRGRRYVFYACLGQHCVNGWLKREATVLVDLADSVQRDHGVQGGAAEIGIHHGRLFLLLRLLLDRGETAVAIDVFEDQHLNSDQSGRGDRQLFEANVAKYVGTMDRTMVVKADSTQLTGADISAWAGGPVRLFSIDGGHTAVVTRKDLRTSAECLAEGGAVVLDDVFNEAFPGVSQGLHDYMADRAGRLVPCVLVGNKTLLVEPAWAERYQERAQTVFARLGLRSQKHEFLGADVLAFRWRTWDEKPLFWLHYWRGWVTRHLRP
jgi:hypothetical protein